MHGEGPCLFIENKLLYLLPVLDQPALEEFDLRSRPLVNGAQVHSLTIHSAPAPRLTLAAYGYMAELARQALLRLAYEEEIFAELIVPEQLAPFRLQPVINSARRTGRLLAIEEGGLSLGWGAELLAQTAQALGPNLLGAGRVAALDLPVPASGPLEMAVLPSVEQIIAAARALVET